jgi:hypothetical protein
MIDVERDQSLSSVKRFSCILCFEQTCIYKEWEIISQIEALVFSILFAKKL